MKVSIAKGQELVGRSSEGAAGGYGWTHSSEGVA